MAVHHLTEPGDGVVLHTPAYHPFLDTIESMQRRIVRVPSPFDHDALDAALAREPARLMILCHPHNPTGHVFTRPELERIAEIAARHDLVVVSDEIHADLVHAPHGHVPFESLGPDVAAQDDHGDVGVEGVQPRRPALGDHARRHARPCGRCSTRCPPTTSARRT